MNTENLIAQSIRREVINVISSLKEVSPEKLDRANTLTELNLDMMDMVDIIFEIEKVYSIYIPDNAQIFTVNDVVDYIVKQNLE